MYREIIIPNKNNRMIEIPEEYWNQEVEILVLPFSYKKNIKPSFMVSSLKEIKQRIDDAEKRANYTSHDEFWKELDSK